MANGIVLDLQADLLNEDSNVLTALRKAHVICSKLSLSNVDGWIKRELNGYSGCTQKDIPPYRKVRGILCAKNPYRGKVPVLLNNNEIEDLVCHTTVINSISEVIELSKSKDGVEMILPASAQDALNKMMDDGLTMQMVLAVPREQIAAIVEKVKNELLEWTIDLEKSGIVGEGLKFTPAEKNAATNLSTNITNYYVTGDDAVINQLTGSNNLNIFNHSDWDGCIEDVKEKLSLEQISKQDKEKALALLSDINEAVKKKEKTSLIAMAFRGLKDFLLEVGAAVTAALIQSKCGF